MSEYVPLFADIGILRKQIDTLILNQTEVTKQASNFFEAQKQEISNLFNNLNNKLQQEIRSINNSYSELSILKNENTRLKRQIRKLKEKREGQG